MAASLPRNVISACEVIQDQIAKTPNMTQLHLKKIVVFADPTIKHRAKWFYAMGGIWAKSGRIGRKWEKMGKNGKDREMSQIAENTKGAPALHGCGSGT